MLKGDIMIGKKVKRILLAAAAVLIAMPFLVKPMDAQAAKATIKLSSTKKNTKAGLSFSLKATVTGDNTEVIWKSSKPSVAIVSKTGKVTAKKAGSATITARANGKTAKCKVTVRKNPVKNIKTGVYSNFTSQSKASDDVVIVKAANGKIKFVVEHYGGYGSPIYQTNTITATYNNNKVSSFSWKDSWGNSGTGKLVFGKKKVTVYIKTKKKASLNRWLWFDKVTIKYQRKLGATEKKAYSNIKNDF